MLQRYQPAFFPEIRAFAAQQPEFDYLKAVINAHVRGRASGDVWVWRDRGEIRAICGMFYSNAQDAWLYGMRVHPKFQGMGVATEFTRGLMELACRQGRIWIALDTIDNPSKAPVFKIAGRLGMKLEGIFSTSCIWTAPCRFRAPSPERFAGIARRWRNSGVSVMLRQYHPRWVWSRIAHESPDAVNRQGLILHGTPLHLELDHSNRRFRTICVNVFDRPKELLPFLAGLLGLAAARNCRLVVNHPAEWRSRLRRAAGQLIPGLNPENSFFGTWRIYGRKLHGRQRALPPA